MEKIWKDHCSNWSILSEYADAMYHLARDHWSQLPKTRIDWCRDTILEYFCHDGMNKTLEKEQRRCQHKLQAMPPEGHLTETDENHSFGPENESEDNHDLPVFV